MGWGRINDRFSNVWLLVGTIWQVLDIEIFLDLSPKRVGVFKKRLG